MKVIIVAVIFLVTFCILYILALTNEFGNIPSHVMFEIKSESEIKNITLLMPAYTYKGKELEFSRIVGGKAKISMINTKYGRMWKIRIEEIGTNDSRAVLFSTPDLTDTIDLFDLNLSEVIAISRSFDVEGRHHVQKAELTIPVCTSYEGNETVFEVTMTAISGLQSVFGLLPLSPKHDGKVYTGWREDRMRINFTGCGQVLMQSKTDIVYQ